jgi:PAS domain S-box-containing protein
MKRDQPIYRKNKKENLQPPYAEYQQALIDNFPFLVWLKDEHSRFLAVNKPFAQACGLGTPEDVIGKTDLDVWPAELAESYRADDQAVLKSGQPKNVEEIIEQAGQPRTWFETYKSPVQVNDRVVGTVGFSRDITEKRRFLEAAQRTQKLESLSVLAGGIAHDFNNLLSGIFGCLDLARGCSRDSKVSGYLDSALGAMERARALTQQLLTFAKGGAPVRKILPLGPFLKETANFALSGSNVSCKLDIAPDLWAVEFDKNQLGQVVDNILINAQQAMPAGGEARISAENVNLQKAEHTSLPPGDYVRVAFTDQGGGIAKEILPRIFDPFFTTKPKGSGLGLTTCYSIMFRHQGSIDVESEPGRGSTFHLYLPAYHGPAPAVPEMERPKQARTGRILFMDDEEAIRQIVYEMLKYLGHSCVCSADGAEAVQQFTQAAQTGQPFAAVILDLTVPGSMGGKEAAALIRRKDPDVPLVVSSGYAEDTVIAAPREYGFSSSLRKPFVIAELEKVLDELLDKAAD